MSVVSKKRRSPKRKPTAPWTPAAIRKLRTDRGLTVEGMATKIGVTPRTIISWELPSQAREPSASHVILLNLLAAGKLDPPDAE